MSVEWKRRTPRQLAHASINGVYPACGTTVYADHFPAQLTALGDPVGRVCMTCQDRARALQKPTHREQRKLLRDPPSTYGKILRKQSTHGMNWFKVAYRLVIRAYPCRTCTFALATHGFVGREGQLPTHCISCLDEEVMDDRWQPVDPKKAYDLTTQTVIEALGDEWLVQRVP